MVPPSPWLDKNAPAGPTVTTETQNDFLKINWTHPDEKDVFQWVVYYKYNNRWNYTILDHSKRSLSIKKVIGENTQRQVLSGIIVTAVDRTGNESVKNVLEVK